MNRKFARYIAFILILLLLLPRFTLENNDCVSSYSRRWCMENTQVFVGVWLIHNANKKRALDVKSEKGENLYFSGWKEEESFQEKYNRIGNSYYAVDYSVDLSVGGFVLSSILPYSFSTLKKHSRCSMKNTEISLNGSICDCVHIF